MSGIMNMLVAAKTAIAAAIDSYFNLTTLLLPGDGTNGSQNNTFLDSSTNNFTITRNGNTTQGTFSPFSQTGWSNYFGATSTYLSFGSNSAFAFGTGAYTVEFFYFPTTNSGSQWICSNDASGGLNIWVDTGTLNIGYWGAGGFSTIASAFTLNAWNHVVICRASTSSNQFSVFIRGTRQSNTTDSRDWTVNGPFVIGGTSQSSSALNGYVSNLRVVKGTDVYGYSNTSITVPTAALTAITNTSLLTCQDNRFKDNSTNAFSVTVTGTPSVQAFSPFAPTAAYSAATNGGSGYFDGTGDYLSSATSTNFVTTGDFTIEAWAYNTGKTNDYQGIVSQRSSSGGPAININNSGVIEFQFGATVIASATMPVNQWFHVAMSRSGSGTNNISVYLNGTRLGQASINTSTTTNQIIIGRYYTDTDSYYWQGYVSSARFATTAVYSGATITIPTAPLTAITNTQLLLNYTNAGITDATGKNVLETVGNAQISTTQSKFGGSSMYFDGTGDYLVGPSNAFYNFGTGDFTIECWIRFSTVNAAKMIVSSNYNSGTGGGGWAFIYRGDISSLSMSVNSNVTYTKSWSPSANTWYHVAVCRSGTNMRLFVDGTQLGTTSTSSDNVSGASTIVVGGNLGGGTNLTLDGYIDDLRITNYARYTSNFTPPTAAFALQ
jgi:hypothetical protein